MTQSWCPKSRLPARGGFPVSTMPDQGPRPSPFPKVTRRPAPPRPFPGPPSRPPSASWAGRRWVSGWKRPHCGRWRAARASFSWSLCPRPAAGPNNLPRREGCGAHAQSPSPSCLGWGFRGRAPGPAPQPPYPVETPRSPISPSSSSSSSSSISSRTSLVIMGMSPPAARNLARSWGLLGVRNFGSLTRRAPWQGRQGASHSRLRGRCAQSALGESGPEWCVQDNLWLPEPSGPLSMPSERRGSLRSDWTAAGLRAPRRKSGEERRE